MKKQKQKKTWNNNNNQIEQSYVIGSLTFLFIFLYFQILLIKKF